MAGWTTHAQQVPQQQRQWGWWLGLLQPEPWTQVQLRPVLAHPLGRMLQYVSVQGPKVPVVLQEQQHPLWWRCLLVQVPVPGEALVLEVVPLELVLVLAAGVRPLVTVLCVLVQRSLPAASRWLAASP